MILGQVIDLIKGEVHTQIDVQQEYDTAFACDLMSDCLALIDKKCLLITGLLNVQSLRTAEILDIDCIIFVRGKKPNHDLIVLATERNITLISTHLSMYETSGILYSNGLNGLQLLRCDEHESS
jgi:hypothetical protein